MSLYLVERTLPFDRDPALPGLEETLMGQRDRFLGHHDEEKAAWICSLITPDGKRSFCLYMAPNPETVRTAAARNGLPIDRINEVRFQAPPGLKGIGTLASLNGTGENAPSSHQPQ